MTDDDRRALYGALLRGVAREAQDQLCARDDGHAWGEWRRFQVCHDVSDVPLAFESGIAVDRAVHIAAERRCLNCGKEQRSA